MKTPFRLQSIRLLAAFALPLTLFAGAVPAAGQGMFDPVQGLYDPPLFVTNHSDRAVSLQWQTTIPGMALSPVRSATVEAGATAHRIDPGLFWIVTGKATADAELLVDNNVYVSRLDDDRFVTQSVLKVTEFATLPDVLHSALAVTIDADGGITLATQAVE